MLVGTAVELARPVIEVREVVESYRSCRIVIDGWAETVHAAVAAMSAFDRRHPGVLPTLVPLATELEALLRNGWGDARLLDRVSAELAALLPAVVPADVPRPDDDRTWTFAPPH